MGMRSEVLSLLVEYWRRGKRLGRRRAKAEGVRALRIGANMVIGWD